MCTIDATFCRLLCSPSLEQSLRPLLLASGAVSTSTMSQPVATNTNTVAPSTTTATTPAQVRLFSLFCLVLESLARNCLERPDTAFLAACELRGPSQGEDFEDHDQPSRAGTALEGEACWPGENSSKLLECITASVSTSRP